MSSFDESTFDAIANALEGSMKGPANDAAMEHGFKELGSVYKAATEAGLPTDLAEQITYAIFMEGLIQARGGCDHDD